MQDASQDEERCAGAGGLRLGRRWTMIANMMSKVLSRGRVTIPIELRRKLGWKAGTRLIVREVDERIVVMTFAQYVRSLRGKYKGWGLMRALREDRQCEAEL
jgi:AbrB family looped-hinge helix DNA binding protein